MDLRQFAAVMSLFLLFGCLAEPQKTSAQAQSPPPNLTPSSDRSLAPSIQSVTELKSTDYDTLVSSNLPLACKYSDGNQKYPTKIYFAGGYVKFETQYDGPANKTFVSKSAVIGDKFYIGVENMPGTDCKWAEFDNTSGCASLDFIRRAGQLNCTDAIILDDIFTPEGKICHLPGNDAESNILAGYFPCMLN